MRLRRFDLIVTCVCCATLGYFGWHAFEGPRGYPYRDQLSARAAGLDVKVEAIRRDRIQLESRVALLRPESIDPDMLDELARSQLQMVRAGDVVAFVSE